MAQGWIRMSWTATGTTLRRRQLSSWSRSRKRSRSSGSGAASSRCAITSPHQARPLLPASQHHRLARCVARDLCCVFFTGIGCWQFLKGFDEFCFGTVYMCQCWMEIDFVHNCNQNMDIHVYFIELVLLTSNLLLLFSFFALPLSILFGHFSGCFPPPFRLDTGCINDMNAT